MALHDRQDLLKDATAARLELGGMLCAEGLIDAETLARLRRDAGRDDACLFDHLTKSLGLPPEMVMQAQARLFGTSLVDPSQTPPEERLLRGFEPDWLLRTGLLPWRSAGSTTVVLTDRPEGFEEHRPALEARLGPVSMALCTDAALRAATQAAIGPALAQAAERRVPPSASARGLESHRYLTAAMVTVTAIVVLTMALPPLALRLGLWLALAVIAATATLRVAALIASLTAPRQSTAPMAEPLRLPVVSLLVPLYRERHIAARLVTRLAALDYPRHLLDICLILEDDDHITRLTLEAAGLPPWMRQIEVPCGSIRTKPRALNHALNCASGSIIGVYDAEDAPAPDQIRKVVSTFAALPRQVACLQGRLDYYNSRSNWLTRAFTLDYAAWFRVILPGLERLGLVIPLGGTTLFLRREAIEALAGWDAHNVTEDADLGLRIARRGYRTVLIDSVTEEEAVSRLWPWIRQRSRWTKGFAQTWAVHSRHPTRLWRRLGTRRALAVQVMFLGTILQPLLAPMIWVMPFSATMRAALPFGSGIWIWALLPAVEVLTLLTAAVGAGRAGKRWLWPWVPTLILYFPLATLAAWKALAELVVAPFFWDKTNHGEDGTEGR